MENKKVCIYGLGEYGLETYFKFKENKIQIHFFADRSTEKQGYALDGLHCISYEMLMQKDKENCLIIVAIKNPDKLIKNFQKEGFKLVYDKEQAFKLLKEDAENQNICVSKHNSLQDLKVIEDMKVSIQNAVYYDKNAGNIIMQEILSDYFRRSVRGAASEVIDRT